ncbi:MAG: MFS transporter [Desulfobacterales bacterium]|jgi:NNP family nitrate/nitrite transporter-like MFS transporter
MSTKATPQRNEENRFQETDGFRGQMGFLFLLTTIFFLNFISRIILAPLIPTIETDLDLSHAEAGSLFLFISCGYFATLIGSGFVSSRFTHKRTIVLSITAMGIALMLTSLSGGLWPIRLSLLTVGLAAGLYLPSAIATLTGSVQTRHWGKAIAIHELAPNLSFVLAPLISEAVLYWFSWRAVFGILGIVALIFGLIFSRYSRGGDYSGEPPNFSSLRTLSAIPSYWLLILLFSLGISGTLGIFAMLPLYLVTEHGISQNWANTLISFSRIPGIGMALAGGWASDRFGPKRTLMVVLFITGGMTFLLGTVSSSIITIFVFLQPIIAVCFFPAGLTALSLITPPRLRNVAVSFTTPFAFLVGGGVVPSVIGFIGDWRSFAVAISVVGGFILTGSFFSKYLRFYEQSKALD